MKFLILLSLATIGLCQTAGTTAPYVYTYAGQSAAPSLLSAISTAALPAMALASGGSDTATGLVPAMPTTATVGPATIPVVTGTNHFTSAVSGEILSSNTRAPFLTTGTVNVSLATGVAGATATKASSASTQVLSIGLAGLAGLVGALMVI